MVKASGDTERCEFSAVILSHIFVLHGWHATLKVQEDAEAEDGASPSLVCKSVPLSALTSLSSIFLEAPFPHLQSRDSVALPLQACGEPQIR